MATNNDNLRSFINALTILTISPCEDSRALPFVWSETPRTYRFDKEIGAIWYLGYRESGTWGARYSVAIQEEGLQCNGGGFNLSDLEATGYRLNVLTNCYDHALGVFKTRAEAIEAAAAFLAKELTH